ncbi:hypothetical protein GLYMA_05G090766v4 [Glycine max]|nr:hypothetical protein GLYMA_05G090766v4 [Glycine max]KAH1133427.1 hypothetical protein GYH30_012013 [Glycine max]
MFLLGSLLACILFFSLTSGSRCVLCFTRLPLIHSLLLQFPSILVFHSSVHTYTQLEQVTGMEQT